MESFFVRYRNLVVLLALLVAQILGLAMQVRRTGSGQIRRWKQRTADSLLGQFAGVATGAGSSFFRLRRLLALE